MKQSRSPLRRRVRFQRPAHFVSEALTRVACHLSRTLTSSCEVGRLAPTTFSRWKKLDVFFLIRRLSDLYEHSTPAGYVRVSDPQQRRQDLFDEPVRES